MLLYVTGLLRIEQIVTLDLFHFISPANSHTHTCTVALPGLANLSAFLQ